jgi:PhoPQ-activated pathogenicity-related protein
MTLLACYSSVVKGTKTPQFSWTLEDNGSIRVKTQDKPDAVKLWQATNPKARDFRVDTIGNAYQRSVLTAEKDGNFVGRVNPPASGYTAFFVEMVFPSGGKYPFKFRSDVARCLRSASGPLSGKI